MARYGTFSYAESKYGGSVRIALSARPVVATALGGGKVAVSWTSPTGGYYGIRLVRSQTGYPETFQDGVTLWQELSASPTTAYYVDSYKVISPSRQNFTDGYNNLGDQVATNDIPLLPGAYAFYRIFLLTETGGWKPAGEASVLIPRVYDSTLKMLEYLPRIYTGSDGDATSPVALDSQLARFLDAFGFTLDEWLTEAELLYSDPSGKKLPPNLLPSYELSKGLPVEPNLPFRSRKRLIREANYIYQRKGTQNGLERFIESLTQWSPTVVVSDNLIFDNTDASFEHPLNSNYADASDQVGRWVADADATIELDMAGTAVDDTWELPPNAPNLRCAKVTTSSTSGDHYVTLDAYLPVVPGETYYFSGQFKTHATENTSVNTEIDWYTVSKSFISNDGSQNNIYSDPTDWVRGSVNATAPANAAYAKVKIKFNQTGDRYVDLFSFSALNSGYRPPQALDIYLAAANTNFILNPSFEANVDDYWTYTDCTAEHDDALYVQGLHSAKVTATGDWTAAPNDGVNSDMGKFVGGEYLTASVYVDKQGTDDADFTLRIQAIGNDDSVIVEHVDTETLVTADGQTQAGRRFIASIYLPATHEKYFGDNKARIVVTLEGTAGEFLLDAVQLEPQAVASDYFDGNIPSVAASNVWEGTPHASRSGYYPNRSVKIPRLLANIPAYVKPDTPFTVRTMKGTESVG